MKVDESNQKISSKFIENVVTLSKLNMGQEKRDDDNKENQKPWYEGMFSRPVVFRASKRMQHLQHNDM